MKLFEFLVGMSLLWVTVGTWASTCTDNVSTSSSPSEIIAALKCIDTKEGVIGPPGEKGDAGTAGKNSPLFGQKFCVLQSGGQCPVGFQNGEICIDSEDKDNKDFVAGVVGDSGGKSCGGSSRKFKLCCN